MISASFTSQVGAWLTDLPIEDPVQRRLAALLQILLIGLIVILLSATIWNLFLLPISVLSWPSIVARGVIACVIAGAPLFLLRGGSFGGAVLVLIAILLSFETYAVGVAELRSHSETLIIFTLAIFLAGLLTGRKSMILTLAFSVVVVLFSALRELDEVLRLESLAIVGNFALLNGLMALFLDQFGVTLRLALHAARASEAQYRMLIEESPTGILITNAANNDYHIVAINPAGCQILGYSRNELLGMHVSQLVDPADLSRQPIPPLEEMQSGNTIRRERIVIRKDGTRISVLGSFKQMPDERLLYIFQDITERKRSEEQLKQFRAVMDESNDAIFLIDPATSRYIDFNQTAMDHLQYNRDELSQIGVVQIAEHVHDVESWHQRVSLVEKEGGLVFEAVYQRKDKTRFPVEVSARMLEHEERTIMVAVVRDITERKRAEENLRENEARYRAVVENQTEFIVRWKPDGIRTFVNEAYCRYFGLEPHQAFGTSFFSLIAEEDRRAMEERIMRLVSSGMNMETYIHRVNNPDGSLGWQEWTDQAIRDEAGNVLEFQSVGRDITERKKAEEALRESEARYRLISNLSTDYMFSSTVHKDGRITNEWISGAFEAISGYTFEEFRARGEWRATIHPGDLAIDDDLLEHLKSNQKASAELRMITKSGAIRWIRDYVHPVWDEHENRLAGIYGAVQNIDEQKLAERKLRQRADEMTALYDIGLTITSNLDLNQIFRDLFEKCKNLLPIDKFYVALYDEDTHLVTHPLLFDNGNFLQLPPRDIRENPGLSGFVITTRQTLYVPDVTTPEAQEKYKTVFTDSLPSRAYVGVPMFFQRQIIGLISMQNIRADMYSPEQIRLLETIATQASVAIANAKLYQEARQATERRAVLHRISQEIVRFSEGFEQIYSTIHEAAGKLMPCDVFMIALRDETRHENVYAYIVEQGQRFEAARMPANEGFASLIINEGNSLILRNGGEIEKLKKYQHFGSPQHVQSVVAAPLRIGDKVIGMTSAQCYQPHAYDTEEQALLEMLSTHAAIALENARLYTEVQQLNAELEHRVKERTTQLQITNQELEMEKARLEQYAREAEILNSLNDLLQASLTTEEASQVIARHIQQLFPDKPGALYLHGPSGLEAVMIWGNQRELDMIFASDNCWALRRGRVYSWSPEHPSPHCQHVSKHLPQASLCLPLLAQGDTLGILHLQTDSLEEANQFLDESRLRLAETIANNVALAFANLRLRETLRRQSIIDSMTGLYNHRYMEEMLTREIHRARRHQHTLSVLMFDVDNFKKFNDTFGHDAGDFVLRKLGELLQTSTRTGDIACHPHGEEFTLILPETEIEAARQRAERLRSDAEHMTAHYNGQTLGNVTLSIGVAAFPQHGDSWQAVLKAADDASYEAKKAGKNRVAIAPTQGQI